MHALLTTLRRGFKRWIGWKRLGIAASLLIIAVAMTTLVRTLRGVDTGVMLIALTEIPPGHIALAALCVIGAFCTLTFYDFFALRTIGKKHVPYGIAALSSFTSYTIGHNIGATVFTRGAIRFRIYSDYGFTAIRVEGGLLPPEYLQTINALNGKKQASTDYGLTKSLNIKDEIGRYWRMASDRWSASESGWTSAKAASKRRSSAGS